MWFQYSKENMCLTLWKLINTSLLICIAWLQQVSCIKLPASTDVTHRGTVDVHLSDFVHTRLRDRRELHHILPNSLVVSFFYDKSPVKLNLIKNEELTTRVPVHVDKDGEPVQYLPHRNYSKKNPEAYYQDTAQGASFHIECLQLEYMECLEYELLGTFLKNEQLHILESMTGSRNNTKLQRYRISTPNIPTRSQNVLSLSDYFKPIIPSDEMRKQRVKRATGTYTVELYIVIDYSIFNYWYTSPETYDPSNPTSSHRRDATIHLIKSFVGFHINGIETRFRGISSNFYITMKFAGIYISEKPGTSSWTESSKTTTGTANVEEVLDKFIKWVSTSSLPGRDHAMLFTRYNLEENDNDSNKGYAYTAAICDRQGQSVVEDSFNFIVETTAAHELAHSLGAKHDGGLGNSCSASDFYIMTPTLSARTGATAKHPWEFSKCSIREIEENLNSLDQSNYNCLKRKDSSEDETLKDYMETEIGQVFSVNDQCITEHGNDSYMCLSLYMDGFSSVCTGLWCAIGNNKCSLMIPADGTSCGDNKWCKQGSCVYSRNAPGKDDSCVYGDSHNPNINGADGNDCHTWIGRSPWRCYEDYPRRLCCDSCKQEETGKQDCLYGDKADCSQLTIGAACYVGNNADTCCQKCQTFETGRPDCRYGDKVSNCRTDRCDVYTPQSLENCCETCYDGGASTTTPKTTATSPTTSQRPPKESSQSSAIIIGAAVGGLVVLIVIIVVACYCSRRKTINNGKANRQGNNTFGMVNNGYTSSSEGGYSNNYISSRHVQGPSITKPNRPQQPPNSRNGAQQNNLPPRPQHPPPRPTHPPSRDNSILDDEHIYAEIRDTDYYTSLKRPDIVEYTKLK